MTHEIESVSVVEKVKCPIVEAIKTIGGQWNMVVVRYLSERPMGFNEILRESGSMNSKTLSRVLKILQQRGLIKREIISTQPFQVRYSLTEKGEALKPVMDSLGDWGKRWVIDKSMQ
ncbi:MAG: helix-turn-helix transcriptional regulator [Candidatus Thermoplasmatota archaeon]|nr:helix-turn-helix transcriptional regulator [Candidatus Thermoplasmatota archaeon]